MTIPSLVARVSVPDAGEDLFKLSRVQFAEPHLGDVVADQIVADGDAGAFGKIGLHVGLNDDLLDRVALLVAEQQAAPRNVDRQVVSERPPP